MEPVKERSDPSRYRKESDNAKVKNAARKKKRIEPSREFRGSRTRPGRAAFGRAGTNPIRDAAVGHVLMDAGINIITGRRPGGRFSETRSINFVPHGPRVNRVVTFPLLLLSSGPRRCGARAAVAFFMRSRPATMGRRRGPGPVLGGRRSLNAGSPVLTNNNANNNNTNNTQVRKFFYRNIPLSPADLEDGIKEEQEEQEEGGGTRGGGEY